MCFLIDLFYFENFFYECLFLLNVQICFQQHQFKIEIIFNSIQTKKMIPDCIFKYIFSEFIYAKELIDVFVSCKQLNITPYQYNLENNEYRYNDFNDREESLRLKKFSKFIDYNEHVTINFDEFVFLKEHIKDPFLKNVTAFEIR